MWLQKTCDSCGNHIGPFYTKSDLKYCHNPDDGKQALDEGVNYYIDHFTLDCPDAPKYKPFVRYYQSMIECSDFKESIARE